MIKNLSSILSLETLFLTSETVRTNFVFAFFSKKRTTFKILSGSNQTTPSSWNG